MVKHLYTDADMISLIQRTDGDRYTVTVAIAQHIRATGYRFDKSWRHAETGDKAAAYERCCTFAANDIADNPSKAEHWKEFL
jgi:hypothetical protein